MIWIVSNNDSLSNWRVHANPHTFPTKMLSAKFYSGLRSNGMCDHFAPRKCVYSIWTCDNALKWGVESNGKWMQWQKCEFTKRQRRRKSFFFVFHRNSLWEEKKLRSPWFRVKCRKMMTKLHWKFDNNIANVGGTVYPRSRHSSCRYHLQWGHKIINLTRKAAEAVAVATKAKKKITPIPPKL